MGARGPKTETFSGKERTSWRIYVVGVLRAANVTHDRFSSESAALVSRKDLDWAAKALRPSSRPAIKLARQVIQALHRFSLTAESFANSDLARQPASTMPRWFPDAIRDLVGKEGLHEKGISEYAAGVIVELADWQVWKLQGVLSRPKRQQVRQCLIEQYVLIERSRHRAVDTDNAISLLVRIIPFAENGELSKDSSAWDVLQTWSQIEVGQRAAGS